ncbi:MAG: 2-amino-4-hydroxy-6-hydroxymethyldihydropteridine diphosphokinase [Saccharofermentans sp.]|nr:2-amino-4-hydroxy-6-hydroxymethyldihydropteridine diphosphokinase [Saccharofermentans sp.]
MHHIVMRNMKFYGYHGCLDFEKENGQWFIITVDIACPFLPGSVTDELNGTINYADAFERIKKIATEYKFNLIEKLASEIGRCILKNYSLASEVTVTVHKPNAPVDGEFECMETSINLKRHNAIISFGSNMGDREEIIRNALSILNDRDDVSIKRISSLYETEPVGYENQADFLNGVAVIETILEPLDFLHVLQKIELELHRVRTIKNGPRTIDLDVLEFDEIKSYCEELILPHPRMHERAFVLVPMKELGLYDSDIPGGKEVRFYKEFGML